MPDIGGERGGKKDSVARSPARTARPVVFCLSNPLKDGRSFSSRQESAQQELQPLEQEMEVVAGCGEHDVNSIAGTVRQIVAPHAVLGLRDQSPVRWQRGVAARV